MQEKTHDEADESPEFLVGYVSWVRRQGLRLRLVAEARGAWVRRRQGLRLRLGAEARGAWVRRRLGLCRRLSSSSATYAGFFVVG